MKQSITIIPSDILSVPGSILFHVINDDFHRFKIEKLYPNSTTSSNIIYSIRSKLLEQKRKYMDKKPGLIEQKIVFVTIGNSLYKGIFLFDKKDNFNSKDNILGFVSNDLSYFDFLRIKKILREIISLIDFNKNWDEISYWKKIKNIMTIKSKNLELDPLKGIINSQLLIK